MTARDQLAALAWEARQRGISYGQMTAQLRPGEDLEIYARFRAAQRRARQERAETQAARRETAGRSRQKE